MARTITQKTKGKAKKQPACKNQRMERTNPSRERKLCHPQPFLMSPTCKSYDIIIIGGLEQASLVNAIFFSITKAKTHSKKVLIRYLKN
jgi:hypothetical protein